LPFAPMVGIALPPDDSMGTGARAFGSAVVVASRVAVGSVVAPMFGWVAVVVGVAPGGAPGIVVVIVVGVLAVSGIAEGVDVGLGSAGVAKS
jgi:hypothetical protein